MTYVSLSVSLFLSVLLYLLLQILLILLTYKQKIETISFADTGVGCISIAGGTIGLIGIDSHLLIMGKSNYLTFVDGAFAPWDSVPVVVLGSVVGSVTVRRRKIIQGGWLLFRDTLILLVFATLATMSLSLLN